MACRSRALDVDVDGAVGIGSETGAVADAVPVDRIRHKVTSRIAHRKRPERDIPRELSRGEVHDVVVCSGEVAA